MIASKPWYLYIVRCADGALYTGITLDVLDRIDKHNRGEGARSILAHGRPVELVYQEKIGAYPEALRHEVEIKKLRKAQKERFVRNSMRKKSINRDIAQSG